MKKAALGRPLVFFALRATKHKTGSPIHSSRAIERAISMYLRRRDVGPVV